MEHINKQLQFMQELEALSNKHDMWIGGYDDGAYLMDGDMERALNPGGKVVYVWRGTGEGFDNLDQITTEVK